MKNPDPGPPPHPSTKVTSALGTTQKEKTKSMGKMEVTKFVVSGRDKAKLFGDYATYRTQLSNRIHNLRKKLGIATKPRAKFTTNSPVTAEEIGRNHEYAGNI
jgi:hypothetical protein